MARRCLLLLVLGLLVAPLPANATLPSRAATKVQWAKARVPANRSYHLMCVQTMRGSAASLIATSVQRGSSNATTFLTAAQVAGTWKETRVGPFVQAERVTKRRGSSTTTWTMITGSSSAASTVYVTGATWGSSTSTCMFGIEANGYMRAVPMKAADRSKALYYTPTSTDTSVGQFSSSGSTAATVIERSTRQFLFATGGYDEGTATVISPDGTPRPTDGPRVSVGEPTLGPWRFSLAGQKARGFPLLYAIEVPK